MAIVLALLLLLPDISGTPRHGTMGALEVELSPPVRLRIEAVAAESE